MFTLNTTEQRPPGSLETQKFRSQMGQISRHSAAFFTGTMFTAAVGYLFKVYLARMLGAEALGVYALGMTIIGFLGLFSALGLPQSAVRFVAMYTATGQGAELRAFIIRCVAMLLVANILVGVLVVFAGPWVAEHFYHTPALARYFKLFALIMFFGALTTFFGQVLQGYKDVSRRTVITNFVGTPLMIAITVGLVMHGEGLWGYLVAQVLGAVAVLVLLVITVWKLSPFAVRKLLGPVLPLESQVISFGTTVFGIGMLEFFLAQADKILIGFFINAPEVGIYAVAMAIVAFIPVALQSVNQIFSPTIADLHSRGEQELLGRLYRTLTKWILGLTLPLAAVTIVFARPLMRIFGPAFEPGWIVLVIGTLGQLVNCATGSVGYLLMMSGNQKRLIRAQAAMTGITLLSNAALIPKWGITGAALSSAVTNALSNVWYLRELRRCLGMSPYNRSYFRLLPPAVASITAVLVLRSALGWVRPEWIVIVLSGVVSYVLLLSVAYGMGLNDDDRVIAQAVLARLRKQFWH
jgi:O-antigen/teichoic acid export membrane protein